MGGGTTFHFVTEGVEAALARAMEAAGGRDVALGGGAEAVQQYLAAGSIDDMHVHVVPVMLGGGARLFEGTAGAQTGYRPTRVVSSPGVTHVRYRRAEAAHA